MWALIKSSTCTESVVKTGLAIDGLKPGVNDAGMVALPVHGVVATRSEKGLYLIVSHRGAAVFAEPAILKFKPVLPFASERTRSLILTVEATPTS